MSTTKDLDVPTNGYKVSRKEILAGFKWREGLIPLSLSKHAQRRVEERVDGEFPIVPTVVRITRNNICSGRAKGKKLTSIKIRLEYKEDKWMYLVICPNSGVVKTLYINYKDAKKNTFAKGNEATTTCCEEGDTPTGENSFKDVGILSEFMGETPSRKTLLELWAANIWGKLISILGPSSGKRSGEI